MENVIPTIMSALSLNEGADEIVEGNVDGSASPASHQGRSPQQQEKKMIGSTETPSTRDILENSNQRGIQEQLKPSDSKADFCGSAEGAMDEIIPTIMNVLSFQQTTEEMPRTTSMGGTTTSRRRRRRAYSEDIPRTSSFSTSASRGIRQQKREIDAGDIDSILENLESSSRGMKQTRKRTAKGSTEETMENSSASIVDSLSLSEKIIKRMNSETSDLIPAIINTLSFRDADIETSNRGSSGKSAAQVAMGHKSSESNLRRRQLSPQDSNDHDTEMSHTTITEEGSIMRGVRDEKKIDNLGKIVEPPSTKRTSGFRHAADESIKTNEAGSDRGIWSIREVFSVDDGDTKGAQSDGARGLNHVYPMMRNVFSMNDVDTNSPLRTKGELLDNIEKLRPATLDEEEGNNVTQRKTKPTQRIVVSRAYEVKEHYLESVFYVSISAILGSVFRVYMARIFGYDCQYSKHNDFLVPFSSNICVTNDGRSEQTGGALFTDFPSNVFGR